jgi:predicted metalloprotease
MKWERHRQSSNVEDRRGQGLGGRGIGIGTVIVALIGGLLFGVDPLTMQFRSKALRQLRRPTTGMRRLFLQSLRIPRTCGQD